jgi:cytochrome P450
VPRSASLASRADYAEEGLRVAQATLNFTALDLTDPATFVRRDPHAYWREVREREPVYWHESVGGKPGFWVVSRHADVLACYLKSQALSSARGTVLDVLLNGGDSAGGRMLAVTDRPRHQLLRNLLLQAFSPRVLGDVVDRVERRTRHLIASVADRGAFDFAAEVAEHIPMSTICDLLAVPHDDRPVLLRWNKLALSGEVENTDPLDSLEARNEVLLYFLQLGEERRQRPGDDVVSLMVSTDVDGQRLSIEDVALNCYSLILGGDESSRVSAIGAVHALAEHPDQWRALCAGEANLDSAVEEVVRWVTPAMHFARTATRDLVIGGCKISAGDIVTMWNTSANNDERIFDFPRRFRVGRTPNKHVAFGHGPHFCVGAFLGRAELRALLRALVSTVREIDLCGEPERIYSNFLYGHSSLPVALTVR